MIYPYSKKLKLFASSLQYITRTFFLFFFYFLSAYLVVPLDTFTSFFNAFDRVPFVLFKKVF
jgi:hypothetical protein